MPNTLEGFRNTDTKEMEDGIHFCGYISFDDDERICELCGEKMHINDDKHITLKHLPFGNIKTFIEINRLQFRCSNCNNTRMQKISFKSDNHIITIQLKIMLNPYLLLTTILIKKWHIFQVLLEIL